jgi:hypothetical protein
LADGRVKELAAEHDSPGAVADYPAQERNHFVGQGHRTLAASLDPPVQLRLVADVDPPAFQVQILDQQVNQLAGPNSRLGQREMDGKRPWVGSLEECSLRVENENGLCVLDWEALTGEAGEGVTVSGVNENAVGTPTESWALSWAASCSAACSLSPTRRRTGRWPSR